MPIGRHPRRQHGAGSFQSVPSDAHRHCDHLFIAIGYFLLPPTTPSFLLVDKTIASHVPLSRRSYLSDECDGVENCLVSSLARCVSTISSSSSRDKNNNSYITRDNALFEPKKIKPKRKLWSYRIPLRAVSDGAH